MRVEAVATRPDRVPAPVAEQRAESLAARQESARIVEKRRELGGDGEHRGAPLGQELIDTGSNEVN
jgi:hypothetical protein